MYRARNFILLFCIPIIKLTVAFINIESIYDDLSERNKFCDLDECTRTNDLNYTILNYGCHCDVNCVRFGTCCLNSPYIQAPRPKLQYTCRKVYNGLPCFMMDRCPTNDSVWESQCREEKVNYDEEEDFLKLVPVTSLVTSVTYKNYFCFRCHERNEEFVYWTPKLQAGVYDTHYESMSSEELQSDFEKQLYTLTNEKQEWTASFRNGSVRLPVWLTLEVPEEIKPLVIGCDQNIIRDCSPKWTDSEIREKCHSYMGVRHLENDIIIYKNFYCALCNFEDFKNITCLSEIRYGGGGARGKVFFSFSHLIDINKSEGDKVGKIQKCSDDHIWDPYGRKCRKLTCALPGYKIKNGKCRPQ